MVVDDGFVQDLRDGAVRTGVVEEVDVGKEVTERTETVSDTLRRTDVEVEQLGAQTTAAGSATILPGDEEFRGAVHERAQRLDVPTSAARLAASSGGAVSGGSTARRSAALPLWLAPTCS